MEENDKLSEALECAVCLEVLSVDNKVLPCQHTFCTQCLHAVKSSLIDLSLPFRCPECRSAVNVDVDKLPSNIILKRVLNNLNSSKTQSKQQTIEQEDLEERPVRKRIRPIAESNDDDGSDDEPPISAKTVKKGQKSKPLCVSEEESEEIYEESGSESSDETSDVEATETEASSRNGACDTTGSETEAYSKEELTDDDSQQTPDNQRPTAEGASSSRRSSRIKDKHSREFRKPKKEDVFNAIPSLPEGDISLSELRPRKLVTAFTKVHSHYNYDPDYTSGEDTDMADFLEDDFEYVDDNVLVSEDSNYDPQQKCKKTLRNSNKRRKRRKKTTKSDNSSEESSAANATEYSSEISDSSYTNTPIAGPSSAKKLKPRLRLRKIQRTQSSSDSSEKELADIDHGRTDSGRTRTLEK